MPEQAASTPQLVPILLNILAAIIGASGQLLYKKGALALSTIPAWRNLPLLCGCLCFCGVMVLFIAGYRLGGKVSVSYPFYATTFIWSALIARFVFIEPIHLLQWVGIFFITSGIALIAAG